MRGVPCSDDDDLVDIARLVLRCRNVLRVGGPDLERMEEYTRAYGASD